MSGSRHSVVAAPFAAVVVVGSQGALEPFRVISHCLPGEFPAAVIFDLHRREDLGFLERLLARNCAMPVCGAVAGEALEPGRVYLAPCDRQLVVSGERVLGFGDTGDGRPGHRFADGLLGSAAQAFGPRLIAVVLSGRLEGGAVGVREAKRRGGRVLVQDPATAAAPSMPRAALATGCVDFALPPESLGQALVAFCAAEGAAELFRVRLNAGARN